MSTSAAIARDVLVGYLAQAIVGAHLEANFGESLMLDTVEHILEKIRFDENAEADADGAQEVWQTIAERYNPEENPHGVYRFADNLDPDEILNGVRQKIPTEWLNVIEVEVVG